MDEEKKSFDITGLISSFFAGMTRTQIGILAGMGVLLVLLFCVGGWFMFGNLNSPGVSVPIRTATVVPTVTPFLDTTPTVTPTPVMTQVPYEQLIPADWQQFKTSLVEIWLPTNFKLADKKTNDISVKFALPELLITEIPSKSSAHDMLVNVSYDLMTGDSLDKFLDSKFPNIPYQAQVTDRRTVYVNTVEARRIMMEFRINNINFNDMIYVMLDGNTVWYVEYVAEISEFFDNLPIFEQSIKTFRPVKY
jgi:hypothetical protein